VVEPIGTGVRADPNERLAGGLPNEDAQSFVFDATSLFERDKFSGFDRAEGGTRANVGMRYTGSYRQRA
jgi:LPS-assembly protein